MDSQRLIKGDQGKINARLIARAGQTDLSRIESATRLINTTLTSPEAKRWFLRYFHMMQVNMHFISVTARTSLPAEQIDAAETQMMEMLVAVAALLDKEIVSTNKVFANNGITMGTYQAEPFNADVIVLSRFGRRYLELFGKVDLLMLMLEMLVMDEFIESPEQQKRKMRYKKAISGISSAARNLKIDFHKKIYPGRHKSKEEKAAEHPDPADNDELDSGSGADSAAMVAAIDRAREADIDGEHESALEESESPAS